jgi:hypothetical protein
MAYNPFMSDGDDDDDHTGNNEEVFEVDIANIPSNTTTNTGSLTRSADIEAASNPNIRTRSRSQELALHNNNDNNNNSNGKKPDLINRRLTTVSRKYDRQNKGYLDPTEQALRNMDRQNKGYLEIEQLYTLMERLQQEQRISSELMEEIRHEHKRSMTLKRGIVTLAIFAVLLALSNVGTSLVAARLAKDTTVDADTHDLIVVKGTGSSSSISGTERIGTTSKNIEMVVQPIENNRRRHLAQVESMVCSSVNNADDKKACSLQGKIQFEDMIQFHRQLCPGWPNQENLCLGGGAESIDFNCNGKRTTVLGGRFVPSEGPQIDTYAFLYMVFPTNGAPYKAQQVVYELQSQSSGVFARQACLKDFDLGVMCQTNNTECFLFGTFDADGSCGGAPIQLCGTPSTLPSKLRNRLA